MLLLDVICLIADRLDKVLIRACDIELKKLHNNSFARLSQNILYLILRAILLLCSRIMVEILIVWLDFWLSYSSRNSLIFDKYVASP